MSNLEKSKTGHIDDATTAQHLEQIVRNGIEAINARDFDINNETWSDYSPNFYIDPTGLSFENSTETQVGPQKPLEAMNMSDILMYQQQLAIANTSYVTRILEVTTVALEATKAEVLMNAESRGLPEGVVRPLLNIYEFERREGKWLCMSLRTLPGVDVS